MVIRTTSSARIAGSSAAGDGDGKGGGEGTGDAAGAGSCEGEGDAVAEGAAGCWANAFESKAQMRVSARTVRFNFAEPFARK